MDKPIIANFRFNKVGQGCFYTGTIKYEKKEFNFVYDCGTDSKTNYIKAEIDVFKKHLSKTSSNNLDMLVISHFDSDHVNFADTLLKGLTNCDYLVLPFISLNLRNLSLINYAFSEDFDDLDNYFQIISDPYAYFSSLGNIGMVIVVSNEEDEEDGTENPNPDGNPDFPFHIIKSKNEKPDEQIPKELEKYIDHDRKRYYPNNMHIFCGNIWDFYFYQKNDLDESTISKFLNDINTEFELKKDECFEAERMIPLNGFKNFLTKLKGNAKKLKDIYKKYKIDINEYSLTMMHQPFYNAQKTNNEYIVLVHYCCRFGYKDIFKKAGTYLTGDINLNKICFPKYIEENINNLMVFQVPHHGSELNWDITKLTNLNRDSFCVVNYGFENRHKHPSTRVMEDISKIFHHPVIQNTQVYDFKYEIVINPDFVKVK